jgi:hypothetical protein
MFERLLDHLAVMQRLVAGCLLACRLGGPAG